MGLSELKKYITQQLDNMDEEDVRFLNQIRAFIKKYIEGKGRR